MISYAPFWVTLKQKGQSTYTLINKYGISSSTIDRLRRGKGISTAKIDDLCRILGCRVEDVNLRRREFLFRSEKRNKKSVL